MKSLDINRIMKISVIMLLLDAFWLSIITKPFLKMTKDIQKSNVKIRKYSVVFTYMSMILLYTTVFPDKQLDLKKAFLVGLSCYAVFEFTNLSIFTNYKLDIAIMDTVWGGVLFALVNFIENYK